MDRPEYIKHFSEIMTPDNNHYPGDGELMSLYAPFTQKMGFKNLGIGYEVIPPGRRTSWPHAHKEEEEFIFVIDGNPDVWINGELHRLKSGDGVGFLPGTGICHTFINNTEDEVKLMVIGEHKKPGDQGYYPLHPKRNIEMGDRLWKDCPTQQLGGHDGLPDKLRK